MKDYYLILGISPDATQHGVRQAFRGLAQRHHPDRAGADATRRFQELSEAYRVLGNPRRRAAYDRDRRPAADAPRSTRPSRSRAASPDAEPFDARAGAGSRARPDAIFEDFADPFGAPRPRAPRAGSDTAWAPERLRADLSVQLSPGEASRGGIAELRVAAPLRCPGCGGSGAVGSLRVCPRCRGAGRIAREAPVRLEIPPGVADGTLLAVPLSGGGSLRVLVRVGR